MANPAETFIVVLCTTPSPEIGAELGRGLVSERLAACVNILPAVRSIYSWEGEIKDDPEVQLLIKTRAARFEAVRDYLVKHHPYSEPEIVALPIVSGSKTYLGWLETQTQAR